VINNNEDAVWLAGWLCHSRNHCLRPTKTIFFSHNNQPEQYFSVLSNRAEQLEYSIMIRRAAIINKCQHSVRATSNKSWEWSAYRSSCRWYGEPAPSSPEMPAAEREGRTRWLSQKYEWKCMIEHKAPMFLPACNGCVGGDGNLGICPLTAACSATLPKQHLQWLKEQGKGSDSEICGEESDRGDLAGRERGWPDRRRRTRTTGVHPTPACPLHPCAHRRDPAHGEGKNRFCICRVISLWLGESACMSSWTSPSSGGCGKILFVFLDLWNVKNQWLRLIWNITSSEVKFVP